MTLSMAWIRQVNQTNELVFASDSRLRGGDEVTDFGPKIFTLPRSDCLISFAGETDDAYPLILQMAHGIEFYQKSNDRRTDITQAKAIAIDVFNQIRGEYYDFPSDRTTAGDPKVSFIFGGFSWRLSRFLIWTLHYQSDIDRFTFRPQRPWGGGNEEKVLAIVGDAKLEAKERILAKLKERDKLTGFGFDMEPFEVLRDMIRERVDPTIGGAPQVAKVYRYLRTQHFAVNWPKSDGRPHALGRPPLAYEEFDLPVINPDDPPFFRPKRGDAEPDFDYDLFSAELEEREEELGQ
jgi:hypothetical protein